MAEQFLESIYQYSNMITLFRETVEQLRIGFTNNAVKLMKEAKGSICDFCQKSIDASYPEAPQLWEMVKYLYEEEKDSTVRGDMIENAILPMAEKIVQSMGNISQQLDENYMVESTSSGFLTLKNIQSGIYLHSNNNPMDEARLQIRNLCTTRPGSFAVLGAGLGYQVYQIYRYLKGTVKIRLYEEDPKVVEYARKYGVLDWIPEDLLEINCSEGCVKAFLQDILDDQVGIYMHYPSLAYLKDESVREAMYKGYTDWHTVLSQKYYTELNLWRNLDSDAKMISEFDASGLKEEMVVVAAGPSLDDNMERLRAWQGKKTILAVGTVFGKLIRAGIKPDLVFIIDPYDDTSVQIKGMEEENVPLILDACVDYGVSKNYKGPKYLFFTAQCDAEIQYAKKHDYKFYLSGGTVTAAAFIFATEFKARVIYLVGVDYAYPDGLSHATDTPLRTVCDTSSMQKIPGVMGKTVYADILFEIYLHWTEGFIEGRQNIKWYNLSKVGARIKGTTEIGDAEIPEDPLKLPDEKISVIIPCYNVEKSVEKCIDSLLKQTLPERMMEFIFVDDDSTDSTGKILKKYAKEYPDRIRIIKQKINGGPGAARNAGLNVAKGDYIGFVDSDDYVEPHMFESLYRAMLNSGAEIAAGGRYNEISEKERQYYGPINGGVIDLSEEAFPNEAIGESSVSGLVNRLYRRNFLEKIKLRFPEKITCEDEFFADISNYYARKFVAIPYELYHFCTEKDFQKTERYKKRLLDHLKIEVMKVAEMKRRGAYEYNRTDIEMQFLRHFFVETLLHYEEMDEIPEGIIFDMQNTVKELFPEWKKNPLLNEKENENVLKICELIEYVFKKGDIEELKEVVKEKDLKQEKKKKNRK